MKNDTIRILFTHREMDTTLYKLAEKLVENPRYEVYITTPPNKAETQHTPKTSQVIYLPLPNITSKLVWSVIRQLRAYQHKYNFDIIFSPGSSGLSNALMATIGTKAINMGYRGTGAKVRKFDPTYYLAVLNPRLDHLICETEHIYEYLSSFLPQQKMTVLTKPFDIQWAEYARQAPIIVFPQEENVLRLVYVGNSANRPYKGLRTLVEAFNSLDDERVKLIVVGNYDQSDYDLAQQGRYPHNIHFAGVGDGMRYMAAADAFILPSWRDASPRVLREAMALSLPTIVTNIPGSRDLMIPNKTGLLVEPQNPQSICTAIQDLRKDPERARLMGIEGYQYLQANYSLKKYIADFSLLLDKLTLQDLE